MKKKSGHKGVNDILIKDHSLWAMGAGLIPIPMLDMGAVAAVQLKLLYELSKHYDVKFSKTRLKAIIAALVGTVATDSLRRGAFTGFIKAIPIVGVIGMVSTPIYAGATTYALGKVFVYHFESGGTSDDFDLEEKKERFKELFEEGKEVSKSKPEK